MPISCSIEICRYIQPKQKQRCWTTLFRKIHFQKSCCTFYDSIYLPDISILYPIAVSKMTFILCITSLDDLNIPSFTPSKFPAKKKLNSNSQACIKHLRPLHGPAINGWNREKWHFQTSYFKGHGWNRKDQMVSVLHIGANSCLLQEYNYIGKRTFWTITPRFGVVNSFNKQD